MNFGGGVAYTKDFQPIGTIGLNVILANNWGTTINFKGSAIKANNIPSDYQAGLVIFGNGTPTGDLSIASIDIVRAFPVEGTRVKYIVEAGPAFVNYQTLTFTKNTSNNGGWLSLSSNYDIATTNHFSYGLSIRGSIQFPFTRVFGVDIGIYGNVYSKGIVTGLEALFMLGKVYDKKNPTQH